MNERRLSQSPRHPATILAEILDVSQERCKEKAPTVNRGEASSWGNSAATELTRVFSMWELASNTGSGRVNILLFLFVSKEHFWQARCSCTHIVYNSFSSWTWEGEKKKKKQEHKWGISLCGWKSTCGHITSQNVTALRLEHRCDLT